MPLRIDVLVQLVFFRRASAVDHISKMAVGHVVVLMAIREVIFRELEDQSDEYEQLLYNILGNLALESLNLLSVLVDDRGMRPLQLRD